MVIEKEEISIDDVHEGEFSNIDSIKKFLC
jgi:hypothetical protein